METGNIDNTVLMERDIFSSPLASDMPSDDSDRFSSDGDQSQQNCTEALQLTSPSPTMHLPQWQSTSFERKLRSSSFQHESLWDDVGLIAKAHEAQRTNDSMVYLDGASVYTCAHCRTHLTSHDDIISKSFHGRHGRAFLFGQCVNVTLGESEERPLITGLHTVCDLFCKRCKTLIGWTYLKAYEMSQKYKEGKFIIEKINLHLEENSRYHVDPPAGVRRDRWRRRSIGWGRNHRSNHPSLLGIHHCSKCE